MVQFLQVNRYDLNRYQGSHPPLPHKPFQIATSPPKKLHKTWISYKWIRNPIHEMHPCRVLRSLVSANPPRGCQNPTAPFFCKNTFVDIACGADARWTATDEIVSSIFTAFLLVDYLARIPMLQLFQRLLFCSYPAAVGTQVRVQFWNVSSWDADPRCKPSL